MKKKAKTRKKPIAVVTSDCHLQDRAWHSRTNLAGDAYCAFEYIVNYAIEHQLPIIAAGDLIDKEKNNAKVPGFIRRQMGFCEAHEIDFLFVQGQHEFQDRPWLSEMSEWPCWLPDFTESQPPLFIGGHRVWGIDWTPGVDLRAALDAVPEDVTILVMHQVCHEWMGSITLPELHWEQIPGHVKLLIVGDYHDKHTSIIRENSVGNGMLVLCPGSTCMQAIDEPPVKKFFVLYDDLTVTSVEIPTRRFLQPPDLSNEEDLNGFCEAASTQIVNMVSAAENEDEAEELRKPIIYVRYSFQLTDAYKRIVSAVGDGAHLFTKELRPKTEEQVQAREERQKTIKGGLVGALPEVAEEGTTRYDISKRLLESRNPGKVLAELREEALGE